MDPLIRKFTLDIWKTTFYSKEFLVDWFTLHLGCKRQFLLELENSLIKYLGPLSYRRISPSSSKISRPKSVNQKDRASFSSIVVLTLSSGSAGKNIALVTGLNNKQTNIKVRASSNTSGGGKISLRWRDRGNSSSSSSSSSNSIGGPTIQHLWMRIKGSKHKEKSCN